MVRPGSIDPSMTFDEFDTSPQDTTTVALSPTQSSEVETVTGLLKNVSSSTSRIAFSEGQVDAVLKVALQWPEHVRFPGLDILRLMVLVSPEPYRGAHAEVPSILLRSVTPSSPETPLSKDQEINLMLVLRFFANAFALKEGLDMISQMSSSVCWPFTGDILGADYIVDHLAFGDSSIRVSEHCQQKLEAGDCHAATEFDYMGRGRKDGARQDDNRGRSSADDRLIAEADCLRSQFLKGETDAENCFRGMVALGTLASKCAKENPAFALTCGMQVASDPSAKTLALSLGAKSYLASTRKVTGADETKLRMVEAELQNMLK